MMFKHYMKTMWKLTFILLVCMAAGSIDHYPNQLCVELNERASNEQIIHDFQNSLHLVLKNLAHPLPDAGHPVAEPFMNPLGGRYYLHGGVIDLKDIKVVGLSTTKLDSVKVWGSGRSRLTEMTFSSPGEKIYAEYSIPNTHYKGTLEASSNHRVFTGTAVVEPGRQNVDTYRSKVGDVYFHSSPELHLSKEQQHDLMVQIINDSIRFIHRRVLEAIVRRSCHRPYHYDHH